jgi:starch synthase
MAAPLKICFVSAEFAPFAKTGGLADVSAALVRFLASQGHDVRAFMPMYASVRGAGWSFTPDASVQDVPLRFGGRRADFSLSTAPLPKSRALVRFVRCPELYDRPGIYTLDGDEHLRFALLARAALTSCQWMGWAPDVIHCNDWHTGLLPLYLRVGYGWDRLFDQTRTVLTIHNLGYQGAFSSDVIDELGLGDHRSLLYQEDLSANRINFLKTGLLYADKLTTVSQTYAREILSDEQGMGLADLLRRRADSLVGIVNGVDYDEWNPATDGHLPHRYGAGDLAGKARDRERLRERFGLEQDPGVPLVGVVSRLTAQKGFDLLPDVLPIFLQRNALQFVVLGSGEERYERYFEWLREAFPGKVGFQPGYDEGLAHWIEAGSDMFLMPSRYEPCGLNQMYSLRYGSVPIVRRTGGLADTVRDHGAGDGTGFCFDEFSAGALQHALGRALTVWEDRDAWKRLVANGMRRDYSWERQGSHYLRLYEALAGR